jgi:hypothetical protein
VVVGQRVEIYRVIRRMRGPSQAWLVLGADGAHYVAKFTGNPSGNGGLIRQIIAGHILSQLGVATPDLKILELTSWCEGRDLLFFEGNGRKAIRNGLHLGSKCPVNPDQVPIWDFLPTTLYSRVENLNHFAITFALDCWSGRTESRQFVFAPASDKAHTTGAGQARAFRAWAIDDKCFGTGSMLGMRAYRTTDLRALCTLLDFEESARRGAQLIRDLPWSEVTAAWQDIPPDWCGKDKISHLHRALEEVEERRQALGRQVEERLALLLSIGPHVRPGLEEEHSVAHSTRSDFGQVHQGV